MNIEVLFQQIRNYESFFVKSQIFKLTITS